MRRHTLSPRGRRPPTSPRAPTSPRGGNEFFSGQLRSLRAEREELKREVTRLQREVTVLLSTDSAREVIVLRQRLTSAQEANLQERSEFAAVIATLREAARESEAATEAAVEEAEIQREAAEALHREVQFLRTPIDGRDAADAALRREFKAVEDALREALESSSQREEDLQASLAAADAECEKLRLELEEERRPAKKEKGASDRVRGGRPSEGTRAAEKEKGTRAKDFWR
eukprot:Hpha_TRINITY_DN24278_c0_g1::TRINITY_DN24278_c0_g1_i1::g.36040::m.36040